FATGASAVAQLDEATVGYRTVVLCADAVPHSLWVRDGIDLFLVTSAAAATSVRRYVPRAHVRVVPPPVRPAFYDPLPQAAARRRPPVARDPRRRPVRSADGRWMGAGPTGGRRPRPGRCRGACAGRSRPQSPAGGPAQGSCPARTAGAPVRVHEAYRRADERLRRG